MAERFTQLTSTEAQSPNGVWGWARRLVDDLNKLQRVYDLATLDLTGKGGYTVKVKADASGFELVP